MARVLGVGGVFFKAKDPGALAAWYRDVLGLGMEDWGGTFFTPEAMAAQPGAGTCARHGLEAKVHAAESNGRFAHIVDPDGTKIELWQPKPLPA